MKNYGYIYKTTNVVNGRTYIGQRKGEFNPDYFGSGLVICQALDKYGKHSFKLTVLAQADSKEEIDEMEKEYISLYRVLSKERKLYNLGDGGQGGGGLSIHKRNCNCGWCKNRRGETRGKKHCCYVQRKIRRCQCGCGNTFESLINSKKKFILGHSFRLVKEPWNKGNKERIKLVCQCCKNLFDAVKSKAHRKYCSRKCYYVGKGATK